MTGSTNSRTAPLPPATVAAIGYGTRVAFQLASGGRFIELPAVTEVTPPELSADQIEVTHFRSPDGAKEFMPGLVDWGTANITMHYVPGSTADNGITMLAATRAVTTFRIVFPNTRTVTFRAFVESYTQTVDYQDKMTANIGLKITGGATWA